MGDAELRRRRGTAQLLHRPSRAGPLDVVGALLAVQAQDLGAARLALRARSAGLEAREVDRALDDRALVVAWLGRGTLHLVRAEDHGWLLGLTAAGRAAGGSRRLAQEGVSPGDAERAVAIVEHALAEEGPLTRAQLAERIAAHGIRSEGQAAPHLLALAARRGVAVLGPVRGGTQAFALTRDWLGAPWAGPQAGAARDTALAELARRYLDGHGPATAADLATWAGLPLRDARAGLEAVARELTDLGDGLVDLAAREAADVPVAPRLLGRFDPYMLGWRERAFAVPAAHAREVHPGGGMLRAVATDDGAVVGTWRGRRRGGALTVDVEPFGRLGAGVAAALREEAADVARFEGLEPG
ncbi:MAG: hypothetical protein QOD44_1404 [Solirubrobacteraceae bacterium]|nr:hypothetical protein [Solirubrobacteraceae bacterium]